MDSMIELKAMSLVESIEPVLDPSLIVTNVDEGVDICTCLYTAESPEDFCNSTTYKDVLISKT